MVNTELEVGEVLKVEAFAGTGKTRCLRAWAQQNPQYDILRLSVSKLKQGGTLALRVLGVACLPARAGAGRRACTRGAKQSYR